MAGTPLRTPPANKTGQPPAGERMRYRIGQFVRGWRASVSAQDQALMRQVLSPPAAALFARMPVDAQAHSLRVLKELQTSGETSADLAAAALLHDVGKVAANDAGAYLGLWLRGPLVLLEAWQPRRLAAWACATPSRSPRYALYVHLEHPQIGARWAAQAGCSAATCWLIAHHQDKHLKTLAVTPALIRNGQTSTDALQPATPDNDYRHDLARLQWADGRN